MAHESLIFHTNDEREVIFISLVDYVNWGNFVALNNMLTRYQPIRLESICISEEDIAKMENT